METHVKVLAVLFIVVSAIGLLLALLVFFALGTAASIIGVSGSPDEAAVAVPILGLTATAVGMFFLILALPGLIAGWGLLKFRPWARILAIVLAVISLVNIPVGTVIGIYGLWVLLNKDTERMFAAADGAVVVQPPPPGA